MEEGRVRMGSANPKTIAPPLGVGCDDSLGDLGIALGLGGGEEG